MPRQVPNAPDPNVINVQVSRQQVERSQRAGSFWGTLGGSSTGFWEGRPELTGANLGVDWREIRDTSVARRYNKGWGQKKLRQAASWSAARRVRRGEADPNDERMNNVLDDEPRGNGDIIDGVPSQEGPDWSSPRTSRFSEDPGEHTGEVIGEHDLTNVRGVPREEMSGYSYGGNYRGMDTSIGGQRALPAQRALNR